MQAEFLHPPYSMATMANRIPRWVKHQDPSMLVIASMVLLVHGLFILWMLLTFDATVRPEKTQRLIVQTVRLQEGRKGSTTVSKPVAVPVPVPVPEIKEEAPVAKIEEKPVEEKKEEPKIQEKKEEVVEPKIEKEVIPEPELVKPKDVEKSAVVEEVPKAVVEVAPPKPDPIIKKTLPTKPAPKAPVKKPVPQKTSATKVQATKPVQNKPVTKAKPQPPAAKPAQKSETAKKSVSKPVENAAPKPDPRIAEAKAKQRKLIAEAQENLSKVDQSRTKGTPGKSLSSINLPNIPGVIGGLEIDALPTTAQVTLNAHEISYRDELAYRLKLLLRLPEYGKVKLKLTLLRTGKVLKVEIVGAESSANKKYIESTVPTLSFPPFGNNFEGLNQYTFVISLSNE